MGGILASMIDGVLVGSVYGLAAMGLSLIWGVMDVINLTHGSMIALGMFGMYMLFAAFTINAYVLLLPVIAAGMILGIIVYWISVHWVVGRSVLMSLLSTFAVNMMVIGIGTAIWSTSPYNVNFSLPGITVGDYTFTGNHIAAAISAVVVALALELFLFRTRPGKAIRAVSAESRCRRIDGHFLDRRAGHGIRHRHRPGGSLGRAGIHVVSLHHSFRRGLRIEELRGDGAGGTGQAVRRAGHGRAAGPAGRSGDTFHCGQLGAAD